MRCLLIRRWLNVFYEFESIRHFYFDLLPLFRTYLLIPWRKSGTNCLGVDPRLMMINPVDDIAINFAVLFRNRIKPD